MITLYNYDYDYVISQGSLIYHVHCNQIRQKRLYNGTFWCSLL